MRDKLRQCLGDAPWKEGIGEDTASLESLIALNAGKEKLYLRDFEVEKRIQKGEMLRWKIGK